MRAEPRVPFGQLIERGGPGDGSLGPSLARRASVICSAVDMSDMSPPVPLAQAAAEAQANAAKAEAEEQKRSRFLVF